MARLRWLTDLSFSFLNSWTTTNDKSDVHVSENSGYFSESRCKQRRQKISRTVLKHAWHNRDEILPCCLVPSTVEHKRMFILMRSYASGDAATCKGWSLWVLVAQRLSLLSPSFLWRAFMQGRGTRVLLSMTNTGCVLYRLSQTSAAKIQDAHGLFKQWDALFALGFSFVLDCLLGLSSSWSCLFFRYWILGSRIVERVNDCEAGFSA